MDGKLIKSFAVYAYSFVLLLLFNSVLMKFLLGLGVSQFLVELLVYSVSPVFLFYSYRFSLKKFAQFSDERKIFKGWIYHFVPFVFISFLFSFFVKTPFGFFVFLNLEIVVIFLTFKFSYERVLRR